MKKSKFLVLALAVAVMLMGAGYAYWQEDLTIGNTITTGKLDFTFQKASIMEVDDYMDRGIEKSSCKVNQDDNQVDIVLQGMYPGAEAKVYFELLNSGTMKAKLKNFAVSEFDQDDFFNITSLKVNNEQKLTSSTNIQNLDTLLENLNITIEPTKNVSFEIILEIDKNADEDDVKELLGGIGGEAIKFSITALGLQYNDDRY